MEIFHCSPSSKYDHGYCSVGICMEQKTIVSVAYESSWKDLNKNRLTSRVCFLFPVWFPSRFMAI